MRRAARIDANQNESVDGIRRFGATVVSLAAVGNGCPDILVGFRARNFLFEIKDGGKTKSRRQLTPDQKKFHAEWRGQLRVVKSLEEAIAVLTESYQ